MQLGVRLTPEEAEKLSAAWLELFPEMRTFLECTVDVPYELAKLLDLTPVSHHQQTHDDRFLNHPDNEGCWDKPNRILGMMCMKTLKVEDPRTKVGRPYSDAEIEYFWTSLEKRVDLVPQKLQRAVRQRCPSPALQRAVMTAAGSSGVCAFTGQLRGKASYCACHNTIFQGLAADGAKIALWKLWRAEFRLVNFIHDEVLIEVAADADLKAQADRIRKHMIDGMKEVVPDVLVDVSYAATDRWYKEAEAVWDDKGRKLMLWQPQEKTQGPQSNSREAPQRSPSPKEAPVALPVG